VNTKESQLLPYSGIVDTEGEEALMSLSKYILVFLLLLVPGSSEAQRDRIISKGKIKTEARVYALVDSVKIVGAASTQTRSIEIIGYDTGAIRVFMDNRADSVNIVTHFEISDGTNAFYRYIQMTDTIFVSGTADTTLFAEIPSFPSWAFSGRVSLESRAAATDSVKATITLILQSNINGKLNR
jgi:hypothetical protein